MEHEIEPTSEERLQHQCPDDRNGEAQPKLTHRQKEMIEENRLAAQLKKARKNDDQLKEETAKSHCGEENGGRGKDANNRRRVV